MTETKSIAADSEPPEETPASRVASERVTAAIRTAILAGRFAPGSRIRQEELAEEFGTSRLPVREALKRLESEGLILLVPNSGAWVAKLDLAECIEVYKMRERLEPLALGEGTGTLSDDVVARMEDLAAQMEETEDIEAFIRLDREFHLLSYGHANMPRLTRMIERFWNSTQHYRRAFATVMGVAGLRLVHYEHRLLIEALKRRDSEEAERILYGHIRRTRLELERHQDLFETKPRPRKAAR
jgi:DNA-binding GntR family transcriptional regulator